MVLLWYLCRTAIIEKIWQIVILKELVLSIPIGFGSLDKFKLANCGKSRLAAANTVLVSDDNRKKLTYQIAIVKEISLSIPTGFAGVTNLSKWATGNYVLQHFNVVPVPHCNPKRN